MLSKAVSFAIASRGKRIYNALRNSESLAFDGANYYAILMRKKKKEREGEKKGKDKKRGRGVNRCVSLLFPRIPHAPERLKY